MCVLIGASQARAPPDCKHSPNRVCHVDDCCTEHEQVPVWHCRSLLPQHSTPVPTLLPTPPPWRRRTCSPSRGRCCSVAQRLLHSISAVLFRAYYFSNQRQYNLPWTLVVTTARHCNIAGAYFQFLTSGTLDSLFCASMTELAGPPPLLAERHPDWPNGTQIGPVGPGGRFGCVPSKLTNFTPIIYALGRPALDGHLDGHLDGVWTGKKITDALTENHCSKSCQKLE